MTQTPNSINSISNEKIKRIRALALKKNRDAEKLFVVEGAEHIAKAIKNGWQLETLLHNAENTENNSALLQQCQAQNAAIYEVNEKVAAHATNRDNPQDFIAVFQQKYATLEAEKNTPQNMLFLGLENVRDSGNLGSIIRTADAVGVAKILLIGNCCDAFAPEVIRATTGSFSAVPLVKISASDFLAWRKNFVGRVIGTHLHEKAVDYRAIEPARPALLLMGGEQAGLSAELTTICDVLAKIPMREGVESLNLAASTAIMLYSLAS